MATFSTFVILALGPGAELGDWSRLDVQIAAIASLAAVSCTLPGIWLVLRRHSMMGDALSHTALLGIVVAVLAAGALRSAGWFSEERYAAIESIMIFSGAVLAGLLTTWLTEWIQQMGHVESNTALGVVFTSLFALGLFLIRFQADDVHIDADCVLFGQVVIAALDTVNLWGYDLPRSVLVNGGICLVNLALMLLFFKELRIASFDPELAMTQGINARMMHYAHMTVTAVTVVAAFETVGSILVIGLLVVPAATAMLLTDRLTPLILLAVCCAVLSAVLGHWLSQTLPGAVLPSFGWQQVSDASTSGMIAVTTGLLFLLAWVFSPRHGLLSHSWSRFCVTLRITREDILGLLYREQEEKHPRPMPRERIAQLGTSMQMSGWLRSLALWMLKRGKLITLDGQGYWLTPAGLAEARAIIAGHRLWESYVDRHYDLSGKLLHSTAHRAEHFIDQEMRGRLSDELDTPSTDPHGRPIPRAEKRPPSDASGS